MEKVTLEGETFQEDLHTGKNGSLEGETARIGCTASYTHFQLDLSLSVEQWD